MKSINQHIIFLVGVVLILAACSSPKGTVKIDNAGDEAVVENDSIQHEMETFDSKFETWYTLHDSPAKYRSETYYENWNQQYVSAWNNKAMNSQKSDFFEPIIGWDPTVDYEFDIDHELFYYFMYVENVLKIQIMSGGPQAPVF